MNILLIKQYGKFIIIIALLGTVIFQRIEISGYKSDLKKSQFEYAQCSTVRDLQNQGILQLKKEEQAQAAKLANANKLAEEKAKVSAKAIEEEQSIKYEGTCEQVIKQAVPRGLTLQEKYK